MSYGIAVVTPASPTIAVTAAEAKTHCRIDSGITDFDTWFANAIAAAQEYVERWTHRILLSSTWDIKFDRFPGGSEAFAIPLIPLASVTSVSYRDSAGDLQVWSSSNYVVSADREPGIIRPAYSVVWPTTRAQPDAVIVRVVAGYSAAATVPQGLKYAILLLVGHWFANRESVVVGTISGKLEQTVDSLCQSFRVGDEFTCYEPANSATP